MTKTNTHHKGSDDVAQVDDIDLEGLLLSSLVSKSVCIHRNVCTCSFSNNVVGRYAQCPQRAGVRLNEKKGTSKILSKSIGRIPMEIFPLQFSNRLMISPLKLGSNHKVKIF